MWMRSQRRTVVCIRGYSPREEHWNKTLQPLPVFVDRGLQQ